MSLTNEERRRLDELSDQLTREAPRLARALTEHSRPAGNPGPSRRWRPDHRRATRTGLGHRLERLTLLLTAFAWPVLLVGLFRQQFVPFSIAAITVVVGPAVCLLLRGRGRPPL